MIFFFSPEVTLAFFQNIIDVFLDNVFFDQFLCGVVFCVAFCGLMV